MALKGNKFITKEIELRPYSDVLYTKERNWMGEPLVSTSQSWWYIKLVKRTKVFGITVNKDVRYLNFKPVYDTCTVKDSVHYGYKVRVKLYRDYYMGWSFPLEKDAEEIINLMREHKDSFILTS